MSGEAQNELDRQLDAALAKYAVEPRAGLEDRVLANLRAEPAQVSERAWWRWDVARWDVARWGVARWGVAAALAAMMVVAVALAWRSAKPSQVVRGPRALPASQGAQQPAQVVVKNDTSVRTNTPIPVRKIAVHRSSPTRVAPAPKLAQFPSPQPLSEQETILANYVTHFHAQAVFIARVANEEMQRDRLEMMMPLQDLAGHGNQGITNRQEE